MRKNFTKEDLEPGMTVKFRNGTRGMFVGRVGHFGRLIQLPNSCIRLDDLNDNLIGCRYDQLDVMRVYQPLYGGQIIQKEWCDQELIWEREEPKPMTIDEISEALGYPVKLKETTEE